MTVAKSWGDMTPQRQKAAESLTRYVQLIGKMAPLDAEEGDGVSQIEERMFKDCDAELIDYLTAAWCFRNRSRHAPYDYGEPVCPDWEFAIIPMAPRSELSSPDEWRALAFDCASTLVGGLRRDGLLGLKESILLLGKVQKEESAEKAIKLAVESLVRRFAGDHQHGWPLFVISLEISEGECDWVREKVRLLNSQHVVVLLVQGSEVTVFHCRVPPRG